MGKTTVFVLVATVAVGCASRSGRVTSMAANDFQCREYAVEVEELGDERYRASGCNQSALYQCQQIPNRPTEFRCERVVDPAGPPASPPPVAPPPAEGPARESIESSLRAGLDQRAERVLGCSEGQAVTIHAQYGADGLVTFSLDGELAGSFAEQCIREAFGPVRMQTGGQAGSVTHTVRPPSASAPPPPATPPPTEVPWEGD